MKKSKPDLISVIMPCYNGERYLPEAIEAVKEGVSRMF